MILLHIYCNFVCFKISSENVRETIDYEESEFDDAMKDECQKSGKETIQFKWSKNNDGLDQAKMSGLGTNHAEGSISWNSSYKRLYIH